MVEPAIDADHMTVLRFFESSRDGVIKASSLKDRFKTRAATLSAEAADRILSTLLSDGLIEIISEPKSGPHPRTGVTYRLADKGRHQLLPPKPDLSEQQLKTQEAFILLHIFMAPEHRLTRSKLNEKLKSKAAIGQLEFNVKGESEVVDYHLTTLRKNGYVDEDRKNNSVSYQLNLEHGAKALVAMKQHDAVAFNMTGAVLNALLTACQSPPAPGPIVEQAEQVVITERSLDSETPSKEQILSVLEKLRAEKYAGKDRIPIHEIRRLVAEQHGAASSDHPRFDRVLTAMRSEGQIRLIAISDRRDATEQQLNDSIPGINETLFYVSMR